MSSSEQSELYDDFTVWLIAVSVFFLSGAVKLVTNSGTSPAFAAVTASSNLFTSGYQSKIAHQKVRSPLLNRAHELSTHLAAPR
jgi:hypothetical protein